jgi:amidase
MMRAAARRVKDGERAPCGRHRSRCAPDPAERAALCRRFAAFFRERDVLVAPGAPTPAWDVMQRARNEIDGVKLTNYITGSVPQ